MSGLLESLTPDEEAALRAPEPPVEEQPKAPEPPEGETEEQKAERLRNEKGQFAKPEDLDKKVVPLATHLEERKALQSRIKELEAAQARERETLAQRLQRLETLAKEPEAPKAPSWDDDPLAAGKRTTETVEQLQRRLEAQDQQTRFANAVRARENEFRQQAADYDAAVKFLRDDRIAELALLGHPPEAVEQFVAQEAWNIANSAMQQQKNPAQVVYEMAKRRGYTGKPAEPAARPDPAAVIEAAAKAASAAKSLGSVGGAPADGKISLEALAKMDESEFDKITSDPRAWRKFMGGA